MTANYQPARLPIVLSLVCCLVIPSYSKAGEIQHVLSLNPEASQAAEILSIKSEVDRLLQLRNQSSTDNHTLEMLGLREQLLRKILQGALQVRSACNQIDTELAYTYELAARQTHKIDMVNQIFNSANFAQIGALNVTEGFLKLRHHDAASSELICVGGGLSILLPTLNILYGKSSKAKVSSSPGFLQHGLKAGSISDTHLPQLISRYLNSNELTTGVSRKSQMHELWQKRYHVNAADIGALSDLSDPSAKSLSVIKKRIVLLWSLHTFVEGFDRQLHALLNTISPGNSQPSPGDSIALLQPDRQDTAKLLGLESVLNQLNGYNGNDSNSISRLSLEITVLERVLSASLEMQLAKDKIDEELNYAYDVVLAQLLSNRSKALQANAEANFINKGTCNALSGMLFLQGHDKPGDYLYLVANSIGCGLTSIALWQMRGGKRAIDTPPNSLSDFFNLESGSTTGFSPMVTAYLNSLQADGMTRKSQLYAIWKHNKVSRSSIKSKISRQQLAATSKSGFDSIKIVRDRIALLHSLKTLLDRFDSQLLALLINTNHIPDNVSAPHKPSGSTNTVADLLSVGPQLQRLQNSRHITKEEQIIQLLSLTRAVLTAALEVRSTAANVGVEIARESQALAVMTRRRDMAIAVTNNVNFYQGYILGLLIYGPLELSPASQHHVYASRLKIISGFLSAGLATLAIIERKLNLRPSPSAPNMLGPFLNLSNSTDTGYAPLLLKFLDSPAANSLTHATRREELITYWKDSKLLNINLDQQSTIEKLSASGPTYHRRNESIKLVENRLSMLYDLRAVINQLDHELGNLLQTIDTRR